MNSSLLTLVANPSVVIIPSVSSLKNYRAIPESRRSREVRGVLDRINEHASSFRTCARRIGDVGKDGPARRQSHLQQTSGQTDRRRRNALRSLVREWRSQEVGHCHVGIMPLPDDEVSRGKCAMKALQFMATGRPVVVSPVGINAEVVRSGHNGFTAVTAEEWVSALSSLAASAELRARLGTNARATVMKAYSAEIAAGAFAVVVRCLFKPGTRRCRRRPNTAVFHRTGCVTDQPTPSFPRFRPARSGVPDECRIDPAHQCASCKNSNSGSY